LLDRGFPLLRCTAIASTSCLVYGSAGGDGRHDGDGSSDINHVPPQFGSANFRVLMAKWVQFLLDVENDHNVFSH